MFWHGIYHTHLAKIVLALFKGHFNRYFPILLLLLSIKPYITDLPKWLIIVYECQGKHLQKNIQKYSFWGKWFLGCVNIEKIRQRLCFSLNSLHVAEDCSFTQPQNIINRYCLTFHYYRFCFTQNIFFQKVQNQWNARNY